MFRNVGIYKSDAGVSPKRKQTTFMYLFGTVFKLRKLSCNGRVCSNHCRTLCFGKVCYIPMLLSRKLMAQWSYREDTGLYLTNQQAMQAPFSVGWITNLYFVQDCPGLLIELTARYVGGS